MSGQAEPFDPLGHARLTLRLFTLSPPAFGGIVLRGGGPACEHLLEHLYSLVGAENILRMPFHIDDEQLLGGVDVAASLTAGKAIQRRGFLDRAARKVIVVPMADRLSDAVAGRLAQAMDNAYHAERFSLVLLDDGIEPDERPPETLMERLAFHCDVSAVRDLEAIAPEGAKPLSLRQVGDLDADLRASLAATASALGFVSVRPMLFAEQAARANAALHRRKKVTQDDLEAAARLILAPRATQLPELPSEDDEPPGQDQTPPNDQDANGETQGDGQLEDMILEAAKAAIPAALLEQIADGRAGRNAAGKGKGRKRISKTRGKPLAARPGMPGGGARLALIDTLRAAVPWQPLRREEVGQNDDASILVRREDLRVRRFEERAGTVTIFCVDASGSAALARLAEAKGAVELMLAQAYTTRSEVALIAFRGEAAEVLLPPTRSLTRAKRALAQLPGGGGTPLAAGINAGRELAALVANRGRTPFLVILTDGRANIAADGSPGRKQAGEDAESAAKAIAREGLDALIIDISPRPSPEARRLADTMRAGFLALPSADAKALHAAVDRARPVATLAS